MIDVLLLGGGNSRLRRLHLFDDAEDFSTDNLTTLDMNPNCNPDVLMDLEEITTGGRLPFKDESFDQIHAYDVLEHVGKQGDWKGFFAEFEEYHRVLRVGGLMYILVPIGRDAFADPGHTRFFSRNHFEFLSQSFNKQSDLKPGELSVRTDYSWYWKKNFDVMALNEFSTRIGTILRKTKCDK